MIKEGGRSCKMILYPLLDSSLRTSSKLAMSLYRMPVTIPAGFDKVTCRIPLSITTYTGHES